MRARSWIPALALFWGVAGLFSMLLATGGHLSMPLDDAYIFFQFARRAASGALLNYQSGDGVSSGATSILTVLVHGLGYLVGFRGAAMAVFALLLGVAALAWSGFSALALGRRLAPGAAWIAPALLLTTGPLLWGFLSGMDLPLFVALALAFAAAWPEPGASPPKRLFVYGLLLGLARPDALFLILPATVLGLGSPRKRGWLLPWIGVALPYVIDLVATGSPQSASMDVKSVLSKPGLGVSNWLTGGLSYLEIAIKGVLGGGVVRDAQGVAANDGSGMGFFLVPYALALFVVGLVPAAWAEGRRRVAGPGLLLLSWIVLLLLAVSFTVPRGWHWHRYLMPIYAFLVPGLAAGAERIGRWLEGVWTELRPPDGARLLGTVLVLLSLPGAAYFLVAYGRNCADIYFQHVELAGRFRDSRPVKPRVLGLHDAGALAYFGSYRVLDLEGLVSEKFRKPARLGSAGIWEAIERLPARERPDVLALYPSWFDPAFLEPHRLVHSQQLFRPSIAAGNPLNVYLADWRLCGRGDAPRDSTLAESLAGWVPVAEVDVADVESEAAAGYRLRVLDGAYDSILRNLRDPGGDPFLDGGRVVSGSEEFRVDHLRAGDELRLVTRSNAPFRIRVEADGRDAGIWVEPGGPAGTWIESAYALPRDAVLGGRVRLRLSPEEPHHTAYGSFHYWVYRR